ncbi:PAN2-PAN3 deadenylation complex subunit PAN3 [Elsinoe australis]|uniref:PAN2-PAN3 deadenylation complex subunit PAN3 n=1 Tax=Elsinoe australis TaxID=40998 RepID=A0A4U7AZR0_9PEZI|nr:PAN2-PAN3 deadenylation complex subunit PAN3 [Elsinoe australis]
MASLDARKGHQSPRPKGRENAKNILCRNMTIYGSCRAQNNGCPFSHDVSRFEAQNDNSKRFLSVDSPSFTPLTPATNNQLAKPVGISPKAAAAAIFTPRSSGAPTPVPNVQPKAASSDWSNQIKEFVPGQFGDFQPSATPSFDPYSMQDMGNAVPGISEATTTTQINPYAQDSTAQMFQNPAAFSHSQPLNYHLYAPIGPHRENLVAYQRTAHDLFIPDHLREDLQRKTEATLQTFSNSTLPQQIEHFHSLVALDTTIQKLSSVYGHPSWLYKAVSSKDGYTYCLRRLENFRLTDERAIRSIHKWKRISNGNVVIVHDAFTTRAFGDSSLIIVTDYHPLAQTLADKHFGQTSRHPARAAAPLITDHELWTYLIQLASALKSIHSSGLAARLIIPQKILLTSKNRIRLNSCGILDITQFDQQRPLHELQSDDFVQLGRLILSIATRTPTTPHGPPKALDQIARLYSEKMHDTLNWLLTPPTNAAASELAGDRNIDTLLAMIAPQTVSTLDAALHEADSLTSNLARELENARLVRLLTKLNLILDRPDSSPPGQQAPTGPSGLNVSSSAWSETGERYYLKLFRDYVFHQVDADGRPSLDLGRILAALNKLDAGVDEKIMLVSRDEQNCFVVSYREVKRGLESAWNELVKGGRR